MSIAEILLPEFDHEMTTTRRLLERVPEADAQWRPHPNVGVQIGWRQVAYWLNDGEGEDEFEYNGRMAGIQGGLVIRF